MKLLNRILFATDFSASSEQAMHMAIRLAKAFHSEIVVLHVIPSMELSKLGREMIEQGVRRELQKIHDTIRAGGIRLIEPQIPVGQPFIHIIREAEKHNVNVIILGGGQNKDAAGHAAGMPGVTAEKVLHKASKPVWVVRSDQCTELRTIICPVDFSKTSARALTNAIHLSRKFDAKLHILHAVPAMRDFYLGLIGGSEQKLAAKISRHERQLTTFLGQFDFHRVQYETMVKPGKVHRLILDTVKDLNADLLVMGASGDSDNPKVLMGSTAEYVIRELPGSIITVRAESVIQPMIDYQISELETHYKLGQEFLANGMPGEAMEQFRICIEQDVLYAPAWEGLAECHERLGDTERSTEYREKSKHIRTKLWQQRVEADARSRHGLMGHNKTV